MDDEPADGESTDDEPTEDDEVSSGTDPERPEWWRSAEALFESHGLVAYRPPRFEDGTVIYEVVSPLADELGVNVDFVGYGEADDDEWFVRVDGTRVAEIDRQRRVGGQTVYEMDPDAFETLVRDAVGDSDG